jgi:hypothetical protein
MFGVERHAVGGGDRRSPQGRRHPFSVSNHRQQLVLWLGLLLAAFIIVPAAQAEDDALLSYRNPFPKPDTMTLWDAPRAASTVAAEITLDLKSFCEICIGGYEISLFHAAKKTERRTQVPRATLHTGFGQFFPDHPVIPLSTSGAGIEDLRWLYVKLCIRF